MGWERWYERTAWFWMILGGFYLLVYSYWYLPALNKLPESLGDPPDQYPWHWPLDLVATVVPGVILLVGGFRRAIALGSGEEIIIETTDDPGPMRR